MKKQEKYALFPPVKKREHFIDAEKVYYKKGAFRAFILVI